MERLIQHVRDYIAIVRGFSRNAKLVLIALGLIGISYGAFSTLFNLYIIALGYDEAFVGWLFAVSAGIAALVSIPSGLLIDRIGARLGLLIGTAITATGILIETTITIGWVLLAGAVIAAIGVVFVFVSQAPFLAANSTERDRMHLYAVAAAVFVAAGVVGSPMAGYMPDVISRIWPDLSTAATYRATLLVSGAISAFSLYALFQLRGSARPELPPTRREVIVQCYRSPAVRRLFVTGLFLSFGGGLIVPFFNVFFQQELGASTGAIGVITALGIVVTVIGSLGAPWLGGRVGLVWAVILARLLSAPLLLLMGLSPVIVLAAAFFALRTLLVYMSDPLHTDFSMRIVPLEIRATTNSLTFMSWNITLALGGVIGGQLIARTGYDFPFILGSAMTVVGASVYWLAFRRYDKYGRAMMTPPVESHTQAGH